MNRARGLFAAVLLPVAAMLLAASTPSAPRSAPRSDAAQLTTDAHHGASALAHEAAGILALGGFDSTGASRVQSALASVKLVTTTDRAQILDQIQAADARGPQIISALAADGLQLNPDISSTLATLSAADVAALTKGARISIDPELYVRALDDLTQRNGEHSANGSPPNLAAIAAALPAIIAADTPPPATAAPATPTPTFAGQVSTPVAVATPVANNSNTWVIVAAVCGGLAALVIGLMLTRRRPPATTTSTSTSAAPSSRIVELLDVSRRLTAVTATSEMDRAVVREALGVVPANAAALVTRSQDGYAIAHETDSGWLVPDGLGRGIIERVAETGQAVTQVSATEPSIRNLPAAIAAVPLVSGGSVQAVLVLVRDAAKPFAGDELDLLAALAPIAAAALFSAGKTRAVVEETLLDPLTGVGNRRRLDQELPALLVAKESLPVAFVMVDLDHFKRVNDTHGHAAGDALLRAVVDVMKLAVRPGDRLYRVGGEEFCIVLPSTESPAAVEVAERVRAAVAAESFDVGGGTGISASASFGVSHSGGGSDGMTALMKRADAALYTAKEGGRDRVVSA